MCVLVLCPSRTLQQACRYMYRYELVPGMPPTLTIHEVEHGSGLGALLKRGDKPHYLPYPYEGPTKPHPTQPFPTLPFPALPSQFTRTPYRDTSIKRKRLPPPMAIRGIQGLFEFKDTYRRRTLR